MPARWQKLDPYIASDFTTRCTFGSNDLHLELLGKGLSVYW